MAKKRKDLSTSAVSNNPFAAADLFSDLNLQADEEPSVQPQAEEGVPEWKPVSAKIHFERKGRGGKTVTILADFHPQAESPELQELLKTVKKSLGCGGRLNDLELEFQGDCRTQLAEFLIDKFQTKLKGNF